jgi:hypothetical protein
MRTPLALLAASLLALSAGAGACVVAILLATDVFG